jgi:tetratricopeptide (TPR) repeat protein
MEREWQAMGDALAALVGDGKFTLERLASPTLDALQQRLLGEPVHVLHFVGHGIFDEAAQAGSLALEDARGRPHLVRGEDLAKLLRNHPALRLAYLNACQGALASGGSVFAGVAQALVQGGVPAAVAMQDEISDAGALELARSFYSALAAGRPVDAALTQARVALSARGSPEWAIPVLFSRSPDNRLFDIRQVLPTPDCPYPGMVPFTEAQQELFFGRDREIEEAVERLRLYPFLAVVGPSGSGKSSLVYAGVIPALRRTRRFGAGAGTILAMRPSDCRTADGQAAPRQALAGLLGCAADALADQRFAGRTLLFVDQLEEVFTLAGADEAQGFLDALQGLMGRPNLHILLTVRADFYGDLIASPLWPSIKANQLTVEPLGDDALWAAIVEPAGRVGVLVDEALAVRLLADAAGERGALPLVQETLVLLWEKVKDRQLGLAAYRGMGEGGRSGLQVAIDRRASSVYDNLPEAAQPIARRIFLRLIQFGEGRADTRRQQTVVELRASGDDQVLFDATLVRLIESRLLTAGGEAGDAERRVDIAHEALIAGWPRLQGWVGERKDVEQERRRLEGKAKEWVRLGRGTGGLLDREELAEADAWMASPGPAEFGASSDLLAFVAASHKAINPGWHRWGTIAIVIGAVSLAALAAWAFITIETSGLRGIARATTILFFLGLGLFLILTVWQLARSGPHALQRLSHTMLARRSLQAVIGFIALITVFLWVSFGAHNMRVTAECAALGYDWTSASIGIAVIADGTDPKETEFFRLALHNAVEDPDTTKVVVPGDSRVIDECSALFRHRVTLKGRRDASGQEGLYEVSIDPAPRGGASLYSVGAGCGEIFVLAHKTAIALRYSNAVVDNCEVSGPPACEPWDLNEQAYALQRIGKHKEAETKYERIIERYPDFAWAHHNLGQARLLSCGDPAQAARDLKTAVSLTSGTCGWFLYDLSVACLRAQDYACALDAAQRAIQVDPSSPDAYGVLAITLRELGHLDQAELRLDEYAKQLAHYDQAELEHQVALNKNRGILAFMQGQVDAAWQHLRRAERSITLGNLFRSVAHDRPLPAYEEEIVFYLARILEEQGNAAKACDYWRRYSALPQNCLFREAERRAYATNRLTTLICQPE